MTFALLCVIYYCIFIFTDDAGTKDTDVLRFADLTLVDTCDDLKDTQLCALGAGTSNDVADSCQVWQTSNYCNPM